MTQTLPSLNLASRMSRLGTETAFEVLARAKQLESEGRDIVHLEIGEPDFDTPANIVEAGRQALAEGWTHYGPAAGLPDAREAVAHYVATTRGTSVNGNEVCIVPGGKPVMFYALLALAEAGDEVIFPDPGFPIYESMIRFAGAKAVGCPIRESNGFALDPQDVISRLTEKTKLVILNSPANPTGGVTGRTQLEEVLAALRNRPDVWILSDEIYSRLLYDGAEHVSPLSDPSIRDRVILLDGFSKTWAMTGWRIGFGVMRQDLCEAITKLMINSNSCTASFTQRAAIEALQGDQSDVEKMHAKFDKRRKHIVGLLNEIPGFSCHLPKGAFYVMPNIRELGMTAKELQDRLLLEAGVAALAGTAFGAEGEGYLRFSYATDIPTIEKGLGRVREFVEAL
ncbi:MAG: aspartate aminotransferase [Planctomycetes bacterium]|nr:aspartate aminotransferase [Planctomycetota bacterium]MDP6129237.1 pyridoxal phosphate-dependent aminotransferase [Planctomycetota bacterium]MDP7245320.1 pyridoxal phosphate-dependent aminotransferase [Planctomycetota bacterium]